MLKLAALKVVKVSAAAADGLRRPQEGIVMLIYHRVGGGSGLQVDLPADQFRLQMEILAEEGRAISIDEAVECLSGNAPAVPNSVVVTFDDGTADVVDVAVPILERYSVPAVLYAATDFIERGISFPHSGRPASWAGLRDAQSSGVLTIGSHTHTHALLDRLHPDSIEEELVRSRALIQDRLGVPGDHFAYPKAVRGSAPAERAVRRHFRSAALGGNRANAFGKTDLHRLARSGIQTADSIRWFRRKLDGGMALEETLRQSLNRVRYARAST